MKTNKIDLFLLNKTKVLANDKKVDCIVSTINFERAKKYLQEKKYEIVNEYLFIKSFLLKLTRNEILELSNNLNVKCINSVVSAKTLTYLSKKILKVDKTNLSGQGVTAAIIDTGVAPHLDFKLGQNRIIKSVDFVNNKNSTYDDNGHGTFVCGVMAGSGAESVLKFSGVAPRVNIVSLKALDKNGEANSNTILSAMEWVYNNYKIYNIKVVCMSFGSEPLGVLDPIKNGAEALWNEGIIVVSAAGNSGPEFQTIKSPGVSPKIITVGGLDDNRMDEFTYNPSFFEVADFSSRGPAFNRYKPDVIAPAVDIKSCDKNGGYTVLSGTSVATPMVAGIMCLICEKYKNITPDRAKQMLLKISYPITYNKNLEGYGIPDFDKFIF